VLAIIACAACCRGYCFRLRVWRVPGSTVVLTVLFCFKTFVSPVYTPNRFLLGILFGELAASIWLGLLWSIWHLPVIEFLGTATHLWILKQVSSGNGD
jgi:hypothetical protein